MAKKIDKDKMPCNKPKAQAHGDKSHVVKACYNGKEKIIRFGQKGAKTAGKPKAGESEKMKAKRKSFKSRHKCSTATDKMSARTWACRTKW